MTKDSTEPGSYIQLISCNLKKQRVARAAWQPPIQTSAALTLKERKRGLWGYLLACIRRDIIQPAAQGR